MALLCILNSEKRPFFFGNAITNRPFTLTFLADFVELRGDLLGWVLGEVGEGDFLAWVRVGVFFKRCTVNRPF